MKMIALVVPGNHFIMRFGGISENSKYGAAPSMPDPGTSFLHHTGPSAQSKPVASFSSLESLGSSLSNAGSLRSMAPKLGYFVADDSCAAAMLTVRQRTMPSVNTSRRSRQANDENDIVESPFGKLLNLANIPGAC